MSYIKVKGGIIERSKVRFLADGKAELADRHGLWRIDDLQIIKESDDIKDLFDGYLWVQENGEVSFIKKYLYRAWEDLITGKVYGCIIMTGKNGEPTIKSVAKRNGKRDWKLFDI